VAEGWHVGEGARTLRRLAPRLGAILAADPHRQELFQARLERHLSRLLAALHELYGWRYDFFWHLEQALELAARSFAQRSDELAALDAARERQPFWFLGHRSLGAVAYVDRFAGDLRGLRRRIPYLRELGVTYLHLMPLFRSPPGENDGGYAVSDYRAVDERLGSMRELADLAAELRRAGISLVLDFILNHTADDHGWAEAAKRGDADAQELFWMFDDRRQPDRFQPYLRAIFPERGGDSFTWRPDVAGPNGGKWVWTTFYRFQWDLNYRNPELFTGIAGEMLFLANQGVEVLRLDAVPFLWKEEGTTCENRPQAHLVVQALNALAALAAPALAFKSEAIVHPDEVVRWVGGEECRLSYNPLLMALLWEALATGEVRLLADALERRHVLPEGCAWVNYLRSHDDIGWGFADEDARRLGIDPAGHRAFLNAFYTGRQPLSFARGLPFQENPLTGDCRVCGTLASLAGLEQALSAGDLLAVDLAVRRILMLHGIILTVGGLPLLYLGDEIAQLNDRGFRDVPALAADARWVHRPRFPDERLAAARADPLSPEGRVLAGLLDLLARRRATPALAGTRLRLVETGNPHVLAYRREHDGARCLIVASFSAQAQATAAAPLRLALGSDRLQGWAGEGIDDGGPALTLAPYAFHGLVAAVGKT
jgi:amylosucrase